MDVYLGMGGRRRGLCRGSGEPGSARRGRDAVPAGRRVAAARLRLQRTRRLCLSEGARYRAAPPRGRAEGRRQAGAPARASAGGSPFLQYSASGRTRTSASMSAAAASCMRRVRAPACGWRTSANATGDRASTGHGASRHPPSRADPAGCRWRGPRRRSPCRAMPTAPAPRAPRGETSRAPARLARCSRSSS